MTVWATQSNGTLRLLVAHLGPRCLSAQELADRTWLACAQEMKRCEDPVRREALSRTLLWLSEYTSRYELWRTR